MRHNVPKSGRVNAHLKRTVSTLFSVDPEVKTETQMVYLVETLASVDVVVHPLVDPLRQGFKKAF